MQNNNYKGHGNLLRDKQIMGNPIQIDSNQKLCCDVQLKLNGIDKDCQCN